MKVLILGSGGREHALGWAISRDRDDVEVVFCPGNGGTSRIGRNVRGNASDPSAMTTLCSEESPDLVLIGPEAPLVAGVGDALTDAGFAVFGPSARAAQIEGSKVYSKTLMRDHGIPTAAFDVYYDAESAKEAVGKGLFPKVVKADGLAAGKGAIIVRTPQEGLDAVAAIMESDQFGDAGKELLIEAFLPGEEVSVFAICRDEEFVLLPFSQDHKRIGEGDTGPNTGGMGAYAPSRKTSAELIETARETVFGPTLRAMAADGRPFRGLLYAGLMLTDGGPMVLEFNCRFGDPETQAIVPLLGDRFLEALLASATGNGPIPEVPGEGAAASVVLASAGYPGAYETGKKITGIDEAETLPETWVFHAGTQLDSEACVTSGGRVLAVSARAADLRSALGRVYEGVSLIEFEGKTYRKDIGRKGMEVE